MVDIIRRAAWHPAPSRGFARALVASQVTGIVCHWPGDGAVTRTGLSSDRIAALLRGYRRHHLTGRGWPDIGYCYAIDQAGRVWEAAGERVAAHSATAADKTANQTNIGVLFILGSADVPTPAAIAAFRELRAELLTRYPRATRLRGHRHVTGAQTTCPGPILAGLIESGHLLTTPITQEEDDMTPAERAILDRIAADVAYARKQNAAIHQEVVDRANLTATADARRDAALEAKITALAAVVAKGTALDVDALLAEVEEAAERGTANAIKRIDTTVVHTKE